ncbi:MAG: NPCBM/NEW2 domain-containing protein [Kiritimatiellae bacterium]|nr:NPCBM/NEW2 domain-containing protein [Kiritimatiellia bacterium]
MPEPDPDGIILIAPEDGGTPRDPADIVRVAAGHYRVTAGPHTITWVKNPETLFMVEATNRAPEPRPLTLEIAPAENTKPFCYYRTPAGAWRRTDVEDGTGRLTLSLAPGTTRIASVPCYTCGEYMRYVESLADPRVSQAVAFTDAGGRFKIYRLTVTNPGGVTNKLKICFGKAMHARETAGYFMAQGIVDWLLSGDPAANLDNIEWTVYPCPDPRAAYEHLKYDELEKYETYDGGKLGGVTYLDAIGAGRHHLIQLEHMWNSEHIGCKLDTESYEYYDPENGPTRKPEFPAEPLPDSALLRDWLAFWPHWFEFGTDHYFHRNAKHWDSNGGYAGRPGWIMLNEIICYGKESGGDVVANVKEQGKQWARACSQVYMHFHKERNWWTASHPCGAVDLTGAVLLPKPRHILAETLTPVAGTAVMCRNGAGAPMLIFRKQYDHGLGMKGGDAVTFDIPAGANSFRGNAAPDDATGTDKGAAQFVLELDGREVWRSAPLGTFDSQMAHVPLPGRGTLALAVDGPPEVLGNWGGARFTINDPDQPATC